MVVVGQLYGGGPHQQVGRAQHSHNMRQMLWWPGQANPDAFSATGNTGECGKLLSSSGFV